LSGETETPAGAELSVDPTPPQLSLRESEIQSEKEEEAEHDGGHTDEDDDENGGDDNNEGEDDQESDEDDKQGSSIDKDPVHILPWENFYPGVPGTD